MSFAKEYGVGGYSEVVITTANMAPHLKTWMRWGGYKVIDRSFSPARLAHFWGLDGRMATGDSALLAAPESNGIGMLRVVEMVGMDLTLARPGGQPWEAGGIYDVDVRVKDIDAAYEELMGMGWQPFNMPVRYQMGPVKVAHGELVGPDGTVIAMVERIDPPLEGDGGFGKVSNAFNSAQLLVPEDMDKAREFYTDGLGFEMFLQTLITWEQTGGDNIFGLPHNVALESPAEVEIFHPTSQMNGCVETCAIRGVTGKDFADTAQPPHLGLTAYRFPVDDLDGYLKAVQAAGVEIVGEVTEMTLAPYGDIRTFAVVNPGGCRFEFYGKA